MVVRLIGFRMMEKSSKEQNETFEGRQIACRCLEHLNTSQVSRSEMG